MPTQSHKVPDLNDLLPAIPSDITLKSLKGIPLTAEENNLLESYATAASNACLPALLGIKAIGELLATSETAELAEITIKNIGWLIAHLGDQVEALSFLEGEAKFCLGHRKQSINTQ